MNYEQKYKEALETMRQWIAPCHNKEQLEVLKAAVFPELKESEDERMLREIKEYIKLQGNKPSGLPTGSVSVSDMINWLEQQKPVAVTDLKTWKYLVDAVLTEKDGIGQYLDSAETERIAKKLQKRFGNIGQKPIEWSEEDEKMFESVYGTIENAYNKKSKVIDWLKSLKQRIQTI